MRRYSLKLTPEFRSLPARSAVETAFDSEGSLCFGGQSESIDVNLEAKVSMYKRTKQGGKIIMTLSGVVVEGEKPYVAYFNEDQPEPVDFTFEVRESNEHL